MTGDFRIFSSAKELSDSISAYPHSILICDENTRHYCLELLELESSLPTICISSGEKNKTLQSLEQIWDGFIRFKANKNSMVFLLGGGVITDLGGLAASTFKRGIPFTNIPTTLMGMVDASHGGKTGINYKNYKNYVGTFSKADSVFIWPGFLQSLEPIHLQSGYAEMMKHGLIADAEYFHSLNGQDLKPLFENLETIKSLVQRSVSIKNKIVLQDFQDHGIRQTLNFGHTFGHAFESFFINEHSAHGFFVAAGIICESYLSFTKELLSKEEFDLVVSSIDLYYKRLNYKEQDIQVILDLIVMDKKNAGKTINSVLIQGIGHAIFGNEISQDEIREALLFYLKNES